MYKVYKQYLTLLHNSGKYRRLGTWRQESNSELLDFSTNDYLNLSRHRDIIRAGEAAAQSYGIGATGSRLLSGNYELYEEFEAAIAIDKRSESSLIFNSGFQANISTLSCILDDKILNDKPLVFSDKLNHSSLYQAVFLSKAQALRYHHNDINHLESLLREYKNDLRPKFIVTETVFGMDGDVADLERLAQIKTKYNVLLFVDDAHGTGVVKINAMKKADIVTGTLSKAVGSIGGFVVASSAMADLILNRARPFMFATALPPMICEAAYEAFCVMEEEPGLHEKLWNNIRTVHARIQALGFQLEEPQSAVLPVIIGDEKKALEAFQKLLEQGIFVPAIRYPTVPKGKARLRITISAAHTENDIQKLITALKTL